jgi:hypothetical protein
VQHTSVGDDAFCAIYPVILFQNEFDYPVRGEFLSFVAGLNVLRDKSDLHLKNGILPKRLAAILFIFALSEIILLNKYLCFKNAHTLVES